MRLTRACEDNLEELELKLELELDEFDSLGASVSRGMTHSVGCDWIPRDSW